VIFNYKPSLNYSENFWKRWVQQVKSQPETVEFFFYRDKEVSEAEWNFIRAKLLNLFAERKVEFVDHVQFKTLEAFVAHRKSIRHIVDSKHRILQLLFPVMDSDEKRILIEAALCAAIPFGRGRIMVVGGAPLPEAETRQISKWINMMAAKVFAQSA
jgi:hypothetical protein